MNVLIVYAHPEPKSFNAALKDMAVQTFLAQGHQVQISDLYAMGWKAVLDSQDFDEDRADTDYLELSREQEHAFKYNSTCSEVKKEQDKVQWANLIVFQFPVWWFSMPAILKGWVDRVFSRGFAYSAGRKYSNGHFQGKKAFLSLTTGTASTLYEPSGIDGDIYHVLWPIHNGILAYNGFTVLPPLVSWMPARKSKAERQQYLDNLVQRIQQIDDVEPLYFHPMSDYDDSQRLKPGIEARSGVQWNPRANQTFEQSAQTFDMQQTSEGRG